MQIDLNLILRLENLARLQLSEEERASMLQDLNEILKMVDKLSELDTTNVEPLVYLSNQMQSLRSDEIKGQITLNDALKNAPMTDGTYFKVPKVIRTDQEKKQ